jgi:acylphosphatase
MRRVHIIVKGLVQGIGFRYFTERQAQALGVVGWVRNKYGGEVEVLAEGDDEAIVKFTEMVRLGPNHAQVQDVVLAEQEYIGEFSCFDVYPTE